ncbi:MAG: MotA/TolQ/ExbB proton channel family protein [Deltaproteobacteria bacterium]|nr:MotA/TolQ/ExbB proton channel family protein [Deltaproteobacteria bacterium]
MAGFGAWIAEGGVWVWAIGAIALVALGTILERFVQLVFRHSLDARAFMAEVESLVHAERIDQALDAVRGAGRSALGHMVRAGLVRANKGAEEIQSGLEEAALEVVPAITRRTQALSGIANIATLLGLVATIHGMIMAFELTQGQELLPAAEKQRLLGQAITKAMYGAVLGLVVAIPTLAAHVYLGGVARKLLEEIDLYTLKLENLLVARARSRAGR